MNMRYQTGSSQKGLTLIEIMAAMVIGLFLMGGVIQIFVSSKQAYVTQDSASRLQENGRFAINLLQRYIRASGFADDPVESPIDPFISASVIDNDTDSGNQVLDHTDRIAIQTQDGTDCLGNTGGTVVNHFFIDTAGNLSCQEQGSANARQLVDGIDNMQILYGVDTNSDSTANKYVTSTAVSAAGDWNNVVSVRIGLLVKTTNDNRVLKAQTFPSVTANPLLAMFDTDNDMALELFDSNDSGTTPDSNSAQDKRLYRIFTTTVTLRNRVM